MASRIFRQTSRRQQAPNNLIRIPASIGIGCLCLYFMTFCYSSNNAAISEAVNETDSKSMPKTVRLICISDTHNGYEALTQKLINLHESDNDVLIHAGDMTEHGSSASLKKINEWFGRLPYKHKIAISGNMDGIGLDGKVNGYEIFTNAQYLQHESFEIEDIGLKLFASPFTPKFVGGFQLYSDEESLAKWRDIPTDTDVLIVHGPPFGILDSTSRGKSIGDKILLDEITERIKPQAVIFGHVHASFGREKQKDDGIEYVNVAQYNGIYSGQKQIEPLVVTVTVA